MTGLHSSTRIRVPIVIVHSLWQDRNGVWQCDTSDTAV
jgi:hypothetical protein